MSHAVGLVLLLVAAGGVGVVTRVAASVPRRRDDARPPTVLDRTDPGDLRTFPWA